MPSQTYLPFTDLINPPTKAVKPSRPMEAAGHGVINRNETYRAQATKVGGDRGRILDLLRSEEHFVKGLTRDEISRLLPMPLSTVCGRCNELLGRDKGLPPLIYETVLRRPTERGSTAVVLCAISKE